MSTQPTEQQPARSNPFPKEFIVYDGENAEPSFEVSVESMFTDPAHPDYFKFVNVRLCSADATLVVQLPAGLNKGQVMNLAQFIRDAGADMEDHE